MQFSSLRFWSSRFSSAGRAGRPQIRARDAVTPSLSTEALPARIIPLAELPVGASGEVEGVFAASPIGQRLRDLGFHPNTQVRVVRRAPLGDPIVFELRGYRLCLRLKEAASIRVRPLSSR